MTATEPRRVQEALANCRHGCISLGLCRNGRIACDTGDGRPLSHVGPPPATQQVIELEPTDGGHPLATQQAIHPAIPQHIAYNSKEQDRTFDNPVTLIPYKIDAGYRS